MGQPHKSLRETSPSRTFLESPWLWLAPVLVPFILFMLGPIIQVVRLSFYQWDWFESIPRGFGQYRRLMRDPEFFRAMRHTIIFAAAVVPSWIFLTLFIAAAIAPMRPSFREGWSTLFFLTYLVSPLVLAMVWTWMLGPNPANLANRFLGWFGLGPIPWLTDPKFALLGVILSTILTIPGSGVLMYSAAISTMPAELFESARLDGAGRLSQIRHIMIPLLRPTTLYLSVVYTIASFQVFDRIYIMTGGGPARATTVVVEQIYSNAFLNFDFGAASAEAVILLLMIAAVAWGQFTALRGEEQY